MLNIFENQQHNFVKMPKSVHKGSIVKDAVYKSKIPIVQIALLLKKARRSVYNDFEDENLPDTTVLEYGNVIGVDFSRYIPSLLEFSVVRETQGEYKSQKNYMKLYYDLLEKHVAAIEELNQLKAKESAPGESTASKVRQRKKSK